MEHDRPFDFDAIVRSFQVSWCGSDGELAALWSRHRASSPLVLLTLLIKVDWLERFQRGERPTAALYFELFPELTGDGDRALSLIYEEFCLLEENNGQPSVSEFCERYRPWRDSFVSQLGYHREFSQVVGVKKARPRFPVVGDRFATYQLLSVLGEGGAAQVYLAADDLGGRKVVLKVSSSVGREPSILANLNHRNIVPILTVAESPESGLRGICMPYRPGITLEAMLKQFAQPGLPRKALSVWELLELSDLNAESTDFGWNDFPVSGTYTEAAAWLALAIAHALVYLHEKQIFHRDIKPANIFLAHQEGPLLFDFNLAHTPLAPEHAQAALNGGTLPYMAPEQLRAFIDPAVWDQVGASADIYALGLVLRELVTGLKPELPNPQLSLSRAIQDLHDRRHSLVTSTRLIRPEIPPSLDAIIAKCLVFRAEDRYLTARELAEDLKRFLRRQPLAVAENSSPLELGFNWFYRRRKLLGILSIVLMIGVASLLYQRVTAARLIIFRPADSADLEEFRKGSAALNSPDPARWDQARAIFQRLHELYPQSAWPSIYLAECYTSLNKSREASDLINKACIQENVEAAIRQRMTEVDPARSANLLVALGESYRMHVRDREALTTATRVLAINPTHAGALYLLGKIYSGQNQYREAIDYYEQSTLALLAKKKNAIRIDDVRRKLIPEILKEIDRLLGPDFRPGTQAQVRSLLGKLAEQISQFGAGEASGIPKDLASSKVFYLLLARGAYSSAHAFLTFSEGLRGGVAEEFRDASTLLGEALVASRQDPTLAQSLSNPTGFVLRQQENLKSRLQDYENQQSLDASATKLSP